MRRGLAWTLSATVVLSIAALWGSEAPRMVSAIEPRTRAADEGRDAIAMASVAGQVLAPLPNALPALEVEPAKRDVFVPHEAPRPTNSPAASAFKTVPVAAAPPPPPPKAPPVNLRFLGRMVTPGGQGLVYLARGEALVPVMVGDRLEEGYVVSDIAADGVTLFYPPMARRTVVPIPMNEGRRL